MFVNLYFPFFSVPNFKDIAAERCTLPYRAPEFFELATGTELDERVDIWSLGCTLYTIAYGVSPFERAAGMAGSVPLAITNGKFSFPADDPYVLEMFRRRVMATFSPIFLPHFPFL